MFLTGLLQIKWLKNLFTALHADEKILYFNEDSGIAVFSFHEIGFLNIDLNNISLDDTNYKENVSDTFILARHIKFEEGIAIRKMKMRKNMSEDEKKEVVVCVGSIQYGGIETFCLQRYWNIFSSKFIKILNYIKSLRIFLY